MVALALLAVPTFIPYGPAPSVAPGRRALPLCCESWYDSGVRLSFSDRSVDAVGSEPPAEAAQTVDAVVPDLVAQRALVMEAARSAFMFADADGSGALDFAEMYEMMQRMVGQGSDPRSEVEAMFARLGIGEEDDLAYDGFLLLLAECEAGSPLFNGLLGYAQSVMAMGIQSSIGASAGGGRERTKLPRGHILDDGSQAWRDSIEAAFDLIDTDCGGAITKEELDAALAAYPLVKQLMRLPLDLDVDGQREYMLDLFDSIDEDGSNDVCREEWVQFFCPERESVPRAAVWDPESDDCQRITGFIFDCDGTIYQPSGIIPGAERMLTWIERSGRQYALLSNTGAKPFSAVEKKLGTPQFLCLPNGRPLPSSRTYTAADAQVDFLVSGHLGRESKVLVLSTDDCWKRMLRRRDPDLLASWDVREAMDVDTAKEWSQQARAWVEWHNAMMEGNGPAGPPPPKVAVIFFNDGPIMGDWSYELIHSASILLNFGADFIYTAEDPTNPSIDERFPGVVFPMPGPGMFVEMLKKSMPPRTSTRCFCCGKGGNVGRRFMIDRAVQMLKEQGHSGERDRIMIVGDRFDTDIRAGVLAGIKSCLLESGAHTIDMADEFPTDIPSFTCKSIAMLSPSQVPVEKT